MLSVTFRTNPQKRLLQLHRNWVKIFLKASGIKMRIDWYFEPQPNKGYVYCGNHFSSFDNFSMYNIIPNQFKTIGLEEIGKLPLYGRIFTKMHILINRNSNTSKQKGLLEAMKCLDNGQSIVIAPEGGIRSLSPPLMAPFEDGAFILAIKKQVPIVPFLLETNHRILPEFPQKYIYRHTCEVTILPALSTRGMSIADVSKLKERVFEMMQEVLGKEAEQHANLNTRSRWNLIRQFR
jgi:1-acyl-sn-glycerol-3-phosphate acyltransferase